MAYNTYDGDINQNGTALGSNNNTTENTSDYVSDRNLLKDPDFNSSDGSGSVEYDGGYSDNLIDPNKNAIPRNGGKEVDRAATVSNFKALYHSNHIYTHDEIKSHLYTDTFRFGFNSPSDTLSVGREYLFFTKPDLNIMTQNDEAQVTASNPTLNEALSGFPFWIDMYNNRRKTIACLEESYHYNKSYDDKFNHLLQNMVISNLDVPSLTSATIDTPTNMYGVGYSYRGSSEASDDNPTFDLEFKDTKYLDVYHYFKMYEEYETLKHHGVISPSKFYTCNKILHDQFSIYKFILDEDMETIIYYGKYYGVMPLSLPRDVFSNPNFDSGITYSISFQAAFYEDMKPEILQDFNKLSGPLFKTCNYKLMAYNPILGRTDNRVARSAYVVKQTSGSRADMSSGGYIFKLKWRGVEQV